MNRMARLEHDPMAGKPPIPPARYDTLAAALKLPADWHVVMGAPR